MKITLLAYGSRGDVQPYVALALGLKARGHLPTVAAPENFKDLVETQGLKFAPLAGDTRAMLENEETLGHILAGRNIGFFNSARKAMAPIQARVQDDALHASQGADWVVSSPITEFLTQSIADAVGARCALSFLAPQAPSSKFASFALPFQNLGLPFLNRLSHTIFEAAWWRIVSGDVAEARKRWGLPELSGSPSKDFRKKNGLVLLGFSPHVFPRPSDWPETHVVTGAWRMPQNSAAAGDQQDPGFLQWLEDGSPPVFFGFGSMPVPDHEAFLEMTAEICENMGMRALIGAGWTDIKMPACDLPDNLAIVESAEHGWLFPQCAAVVHHGGAGTTHAGLAAGVPNLVCSFFADQPFWGRQVKRLGVGDTFGFQDMSYTRLEKYLGCLLEEGVAQRAAALGAEISAENGVERACEALENFSSGDKP